MAHIGHGLGELALALGVKALHRLAQQNLDAVDDHSGQGGAGFAGAALAGTFGNQNAHIADVPEIIDQHGRGKAGNGKAGAAGKALFEGVLRKQPGIHSHQPRRHQGQHKGVGLDVGRQRQYRQYGPLGAAGFAQRQPQRHSAAQCKARGHIAIGGHISGIQIDRMVIHRQKPRGKPADCCQRHRNAVLAEIQPAQHRGKHGGGQHIIRHIDLPVCIMAQKLEEVGEQRQAGVLGLGPGGSKGSQGIQAVIRLGHLYGGSPQAEFIILGCQRLADEKVHRKCQRHAPEQHRPRCNQAAVGRALAFVGHQRPHAAAHKHRPQQHSAGQQQVCHARSRQPGNGNAQRGQRGQRSMQVTFER